MRRTLTILCALAAFASPSPGWAEDRSVPEVLDEIFDGVDVEITLDDPAIIRVNDEVRIDAGREVDGDIVCIKCDVHVAGGASVDGTVIAVAGDVYVATGGRVEGQAVAVNGDVHLATGGSVGREALAIGGRVHEATGGHAERVAEVAVTAAFRERVSDALDTIAVFAPTFDAEATVQPRRPIERTRTEERDIASFGDAVQIPPDMLLDGDVALVGGVLDVAGAIDGDVVVIGGHVRIFTTGQINGDLATFGSIVERDVPLERFGDPDHQASGRRPAPWHTVRRHGRAPVGRAVAVVNLIILGSFGVVVVLFNLLLEPVLESAQVELAQSYPRALLVGLILQAVTPPLVVLLCVTVVLIPVGILIILAAALGSTVAMGLVSRELGRRLMGGPGSDGTLTRTVVGYLVLIAMPAFGQILLFANGPAVTAWILTLLGYFVLLTALTLGLGAVTMAQFGRWSRPSGPPLEPSIAGD